MADVNDWAFRIIPFEKRGKYRCHFCLSEKSVKYFVRCFDPCECDTAFVTIPCCNRCALVYGLRKDDNK